MYEVTQKVKTDMAEAVLASLLKSTDIPARILKIDGRAVAMTDIPMFIQRALWLRDYICFAESPWSQEPAIVGLVHNSVEQLDKELGLLAKQNDDDEEYIGFLKLTRDYLSHWINTEVR